MPRWLLRVLKRIHELAAAGAVRLTYKAEREAFLLGLSPEDVLDVSLGLEAQDSAGRVVSKATGEWMYIFKPDMGGRTHGLLSAHEIRAIRERFGLTQADLSRILRLGANTVSRWESGRNVQTAAMDILLRMIRDLPGSIDYLRDHAA